MIRYKSAIALLSLCGLAVGCAIVWAEQPTTQEPPAEYILTVNGKPVPVVLDKETQINTGDSNKARVKLSRKPTRIFNKAGVKFAYPVSHVFEADTSTPGITIWSIDGTNTSLMLHKYPKLESREVLDVVVPAIVKEYPAKSTKVTPTSIVLAGRKISGKRLNVSIGTVKIVQDIFVFSSSQASFALILLDTLDDSGKPTAEAARVRKLLASTLTFR